MPMLSEKHRIAYFSVPKAACTSLKRAMYKIENGRSYRAFRRANNVDQTLQQAFPSQPFDRSSMEGLDDYWTFTVVRDPATRVISAFHNKLSIWSRVFAAALADEARRDESIANGIEEKPTLERFILNIQAYRKAFTRVRRHTDMASVYLGNDLSVFSKVYPIERMKDVHADLEKRVGKTIKIPKANTSPKPKLELSPKAVNALLDYATPDYEFLAEFYSRQDAEKALAG
ncbi:sulfotransferase family 2 domain-containing protein [Celeribacter sp.]|uniref:sulfotransferase family 2 domain-containing protein n=1 Tax=Celeribacter sp. TaxID=1890673 RepID=UPI003A93C169